MATYQSSEEVNPFSSKFDAYLAGRYHFTDEETQGKRLFEDINKGMCAECHVMTNDEQAGKILFTDFTYDNLGIPKNTKSPHFQIPSEYFLLTADSIDLGLGKIVQKEKENGKFRVPTLRNIALTAPYGHNGYFETLKDIIHFYNVRDISNEFPPAEYQATANIDEMGDLRFHN